MSQMWNLWHGCHKKSEGCQQCYVYRRDAELEKDSNVVHKTASFNLPVRRDRQGQWKVSPGTLMWTCFTSDFFIEEGDAWREDAWLMIQRRSDLHFYIVTKRPERIRRTDERLPIFRELPIRHKAIICEPLLERIDFRGCLDLWVEQVTVGGESGHDARVCDYEWVLDIRRQCVESNVPFHFKQTGALFRKDGRLYRIPRSQQMAQARRANIGFQTSHIAGNHQ